ncbi:putative eukaryotic LigT [Hirschfeldia incana]|nr:putative eukaryotic LigT [Hirschfeldia incana]
MLTTCRCLFRIDRVLGFTSRCLKSKQERFSVMSNAAMDGSKKQKMVNSVWRPISTQSSSLVNSEGRCSKSSGVSEEVSERGVNERASVVSAGKHSVSLQVGASLMKFIRGKEGTTQMKIEEEMGVKIIFPSSRNEDYIIIEGGSVDCVTKASERIATIIDEVVKSPSLDYSHFVSLPLAIHPELVGKLVNFQNSILGNQSIAVDETTSVAVDLKETKSSTLFDLGIEKSIFIKPSTFHLTVLMLKLWNKDRINAARDVLKSISSSVMDALDSRPLFIRLKGLDCMKGSLAKARVLYIPVEEIGDEGRLLRACKVITDAFVKAGLVLEKDANQSLKLHATVMNARHRKRKDKRKKLDTFDAREIHKQFGNEDWGEYLIQEAHLSQRFVFDQSGYYRCCASIPFPENTDTEKKH